MVIFIRYLAIAFFVWWVCRRLVRLFVNQAKRQQDNPQQGEKAAQHSQRTAYDILGINPGADAFEIKAAYRQKISEYHPDKVAHLGDELQRLAQKKSEEINQAYRELI
jgi:DnaJ-class molecular chaperone